MKLLHLCVAGEVLLGAVVAGFGQGTAFLYQGQLTANGSPANGAYDLTFTLLNAGGPAGTLTNPATAVSNGLFSVTLDFGPGVFNGSNLWLQIGVRTNGGADFSSLSPIQPVLSSPYAVMAGTAGHLSGPLPSAELSGAYPGIVALGNAANRFAGSFSGDGSGLTNVNASSLASGTVPYLSLPSGVLTNTNVGPVALQNTLLANHITSSLVELNQSISNSLTPGTGALYVNGSNGGFLFWSPTEADGGTRPTISSLNPTNWVQIGDSFGGSNFGSGYDCAQIIMFATNVLFHQNAVVTGYLNADSNLYVGSAMNIFSILYDGTYYLEFASQYPNSIVQLGGLAEGGTYSSAVNVNATNIYLNGNTIMRGVVTGNGSALTNVPANAIVGGLTTNFAVLVPGGQTNTLCFTNGILIAIH